MKLNNGKWIVSAGLAALLAGFSLIGCNKEDASNLTHDVGQMANDAGKAAGDAQLAARVNSVLVQRKGIDMSGLHIETKHGVVTAGGHVRDLHEKHLVLQTIKETRGVDSVVDQLRVQN